MRLMERDGRSLERYSSHLASAHITRTSNRHLEIKHPDGKNPTAQHARIRPLKSCMPIYLDVEVSKCLQDLAVYQALPKADQLFPELLTASSGLRARSDRRDVVELGQMCVWLLRCRIGVQDYSGHPGLPIIGPAPVVRPVSARVKVSSRFASSYATAALFTSAYPP